MGATLTTFAGASSLFVASLLSTLLPGSEAIGACDVGDIVELLVVGSAMPDVNILLMPRNLEMPTRRNEAGRGYDSGANSVQTQGGGLRRQ